MILLEYGSLRTHPPRIDVGSLREGSVISIRMWSETYSKERGKPISVFQ